MWDIPAIESKETRGSSRLGEEQMNSENEAETEPKAMKSQSDERISNIAAMDNGTMVEAFKFLNYCQLAKNSLTSKRFRDVISTHRHSLALLDVDEFRLYCSVFSHHFDRAVIKLFNEELSPVEYDKWIDRNKYPKQIPIESQIAGKESTKNGRNFFDFIADAFQFFIGSLSKYFPNFPTNTDGNIHEFSANVNRNQNMLAIANLNDENWPVFRHFFHLLMDPFIYIRSLFLWPEKDVFSVLTGAMDPDRGRLQCEFLGINFNADTQKFIAWIKNHVRCDEFRFKSSASNYDEVLLDLFMTGAPFTSSIRLVVNDLSRISVDLVQKFMDLKNRDEYQVVELIRGYVRDQEGFEITKRLFDSNLNELKLKYAKCITEKEQLDTKEPFWSTTGFINNDIAKKLSLSVCNSASSSYGFSLSIEISKL